VLSHNTSCDFVILATVCAQNVLKGLNGGVHVGRLLDILKAHKENGLKVPN
jgi:hypothetical protein